MDSAVKIQSPALPSIPKIFLSRMRAADAFSILAVGSPTRRENLYSLKNGVSSDNLKLTEVHNSVSFCYIIPPTRILTCLNINP